MPVDAKASDLPLLPDDETWYRYVRMSLCKRHPYNSFPAPGENRQGLVYGALSRTRAHDSVGAYKTIHGLVVCLWSFAQNMMVRYRKLMTGA